MQLQKLKNEGFFKLDNWSTMIMHRIVFSKTHKIYLYYFGTIKPFLMRNKHSSAYWIITEVVLRRIYETLHVYSEGYRSKQTNNDGWNVRLEMSHSKLP